MTQHEMLDLAERIAKSVVGQILDSAHGAVLARMTVLVGHQLMMMGQVFAERDGLDFVAVYREELDRAGKWHDQIAAVMTGREHAS